MDDYGFDWAATEEPSCVNVALAAMGDVVVQVVTDRVLDEVRDIIPMAGFPF